MNPPLLNLIWEGPQFIYQSFARVNRALTLPLLHSGLVNLTLVPHGQAEFAPDSYPQWAELQDYDIRAKGLAALLARQEPAVWVRHTYTPRRDRPPSYMKLAVIFPWELPLVPSEYAMSLKRADEIWTPSHYSRRMLLNAGLDNIQVIPNGVECDQFTPVGGALPLATGKRFKFLFVGATIFRKGIDVLLDSYCHAFSAADDVCLVIKDAGGGSYESYKSRALIKHWQEQPQGPEILYLDQTMSDAELAALYRACDVFVAPVRAEGFYIPALEAMASGLPVIINSGTAPDDFCDEQVGWMIRSTLRQTPVTWSTDPPKIELTELPEPDGEHLVFLLRQAHREQQQGSDKGLAGALRARQAWTWNHVARQVVARLDALGAVNMAQYVAERLPIPVFDTAAMQRALTQKQAGRS